MAVARADVDEEVAGRRAYLAGFEEAIRRAQERFTWLREHEGRSVSAAEIAPFVTVQLSMWVAQHSSGAEVTAEERAFRHGFGDAARALDGWSAAAPDAFARLRGYEATAITPWVNARPTNGFDLRLMPQRFTRE